MGFYWSLQPVVPLAGPGSHAVGNRDSGRCKKMNFSPWLHVQPTSPHPADLECTNRKKVLQ